MSINSLRQSKTYAFFSQYFLLFFIHRKDYTMYKIHPIVVGTKVFDKSMMTYQYGTGQEYTIPIYCWYLEGGDRKILVDTGEMNPIQSENRESSIGGKIYTFEEGLARWDISPTDIDMIIHTHLHNDHCENDYKWISRQSQKSNPAIFGRDLILRSAIKGLRLNGRYFSYF
jgi:hypothetical protein